MRQTTWPVIMAFFVMFAAGPSLAAEGQKPSSSSLPFKPGEKLTYAISWSNLFNAGSSVMEVKEITTPEGKKAYNLVSIARSSGVVETFYKVSDRIESLIDAERLSSLSFSLDQIHGKRKKKRAMRFDHANNLVYVTMNGKETSYTVPARVQDALSSLYYVRTRQDFLVGKPIVIDVHEDGKTWAVEVHTLGRETVKTPAGEFQTIKVRTHPKYEGVFRHTGEIYIWLTDDARKIPVLMKSEISIGTINATLIEMLNGEMKN